MASKRLKLDEGQRTLFSVGVCRPDGESVAEENDKTEPEEKNPNQKYQPRKFQSRWVTEFNWLQYDPDKGMTCKLCTKASRNNAFTKGCFNFKTSSLTDHIKSKDHLTALVAPTLQEDLQKVKQKQHSAHEKGVILALRSVYWLAKENIPLSKFKSFLSFQKSVGVDELSALAISPGVTYESDYASHEFLEALSNTIETQTVTTLSESPFVTVLCDESTDRTVTHRLVIYCQTVDPNTMQPMTSYLTNIKLDEGTGAAVSAAIYTELRTRGVEPEKIMGLGTDGASAMTGRGKGTTGMMLRQNPHLMNVHCIAHRLALCTSQAAENIPAMKMFQEVITNIFYYFKYSTVRLARLKEVQDVLDSPQLKFKEVHSVRWMSFYMALEAVYRCLDPLLTYLAQVELSDPKAQGLKKKIATLKFVSLTYILMDIIPIVTKLNLYFQKEITDVAMVKVQIDHTLADLRQLTETDGAHQKLLQDCLTKDLGHYKDHQITKCPVKDIHSVKQKFISALIANIETRHYQFPDTDLLSAFGVLSMRPVSLLSSEDLDVWGDDQIDTLLNHFGTEQTHTWKENNLDKSKTNPPIVDADAARKEWKELKHCVKVQMYPRDSTITLWKLICQFHKDMFPNLIKLACLALICPVNTAGCERGFSVQNQTLTPLRNRLSPETQDQLLRIRINGAKYEDFPYDKALTAWKTNANRKMFS